MDIRISMPEKARHSPRLKIWDLLLLCALLPSAAFGQVTQNQPDRIADAISHVKSGDFFPVDLEQLAQAHAVQAVPVLKEQFAASKDAESKAHIASALVRLGVRDDLYWNYLVEQATEAVNSDVPLPTMYDSKGKLLRGQISQGFTAWAKAHNVSPASAGETAMFTLPGMVAFLAETGDARGIPLLRQALQSPNFLIVTMAAEGLALIQDKASIPLIVEACNRAHPDEAIPIAESLIYFDDPEAQNSADFYLPKDQAQAMRDAKAHGKKPFD
jgi:hypothetical protein